MDVTNIIYICSFQALFFALLVFLKENKGQANWFLFLFFLLNFFVAQLNVIIIRGDTTYIHWFFLKIPLSCFILSTFYAYLVSHRDKLLLSFIWHFVPGMVFLVFLIGKYALLPITEKEAVFLSIQNGQSPFWIRLTVISIIGLLMPTYLYLSWRSLMQHKDYTLMHFSYDENISLSWLNRVLWLFLLLEISLIISHLIKFFIFPDMLPRDLITFPSLFAILGVIYLGIYGIRNNIGLTELRQSSTTEEGSNTKLLENKISHSKNVLDKQQNEKLQKQLLSCMEAQKPYLNPKLSLKELAIISAIPYYQLTILLNQDLDTSFYEFVNGYRVEEFIKLKEDPKNDPFTLLGLAYEAGFNSKSTFYTIFKKHKGVSPKRYFNQVSIPSH